MLGEFQGWTFCNFLSITVFRDVKDRVCCITREQCAFNRFQGLELLSYVSSGTAKFFIIIA